MGMINIEGQRVEVDDRFFTLSPEEQSATVDEIAQSMGITPGSSGRSAGGATSILPPPSPGIFERIGQAFTGEDRMTPRAREAPELEMSDLLADEGIGANAKVAALSLVTPNPNEMAQILQANFPFIDVETDSKGNLFAVNTKTGEEAILNRPGFSYSDFTSLVGIGLSFTPAGRGLGAATGVGRSLQVAGRSALTQTVIEDAQELAGGTFDPEDIALEGVLGAGGQAAGEAVSALARRRAARLSGEATRATEQAELLEAQRLGQPLSPEMQGAQKQRVLEQIAESVEQQKTPQVDVQLPKLRELAQEADIDPEALAAAQRIGVAEELIPSQLSRNQQYIEIEQGLASIIGAQLNAQQKIAIEKVAERADDLITEFGGTFDKAALSDQLRNTIIRNINNLESQAEEVYAQVKQTVLPDTRVEMPKTAYALRQEAVEQGGIDKLEPLEQQLLKMAEEKPTYANLDKERQKIGAALEKRQGQDVYTNTEIGRLKKLYALTIGDQQLAAELHGAGGLFKIGSDLVKQRKTLEKNSIAVLGRDKAGSIMPVLGRALKKTTTGDIADFKKAMAPLDPEEQHIAVLSAMNDVFAGASRKEKQFSAPAYVDWYRGLQRNPTAFKEVMKYVPEGAQKVMGDLFTLANRMRLAGAERVTTGRLRTMLDDFQAPGGFVDKLYATGKDVGPTALAAEVAGSVAGVPGVGGPVAGIVKAMSKPQKDKLSVSASKLMADPEFQNLVKNMARSNVETDVALQAAADKVTRSNAYQEWLDSLPSDFYRQALRLGVVGYFSSANPEPEPYQPTSTGQPLELTVTPRDIPQNQR